MSRVPTDSPVAMNFQEKARYLRAMRLATRLLPGPFGELIARELDVWHDFGYRLGSSSLIERTVVELEMLEEMRIQQVS